MTTHQEVKQEIITYGFENYLEKKLIKKWKPKYFPYSTVKVQISIYFQNFMKNLQESEISKGAKKSRKMEFIFFNDNKVFINSITQVDNLIQTEFSKV